jgi:two-component system sensor histidine kinase NreB
MISERALPVKARPVMINPDRFELRVVRRGSINEQEEERKRISRELHDGPLQDIAALVLKIEVMREQSAAPERTASELLDLQQQVAQLGQKIRLISRNLHPSTLEILGLAGALNALCTEFQHQGLRVRLEVPKDNPPLDEQARLCVYRIAQEALHNVVRHGRCDSADVKLRQCDRCIVLTITDHGAGFDLNQKRSGLGLISMKERVSLMQGYLYVQSKPGRGTQIRVTIPNGSLIRNTRA